MDERLKAADAQRALVTGPEGGQLPVSTALRPVRRTVRLGVPARVARSMSWVVKSFTILTVLLLIGTGVGYFRLLQGPISMTFLVEPIERSLNRELGGMSLAVRDAVLRMRDDGGVEFRLANVVLSDAGGVPVALAPLAGIEISGLALMRGQLAASRIDLIGSRMLVLQGDDGALSLRFSKPAPTIGDATAAINGAKAPASNRNGAAQQAAATKAGLPTAAPLLLENIDLAKALAQASARARRRVHASSYLKALGLRDTTIIFDRGDQRSYWRVPDFDIGFHHAREHSVISSKAVINSARGPWTLTLNSQDSEQTKTVLLRGEIKNLVPRTLATMLPQLSMLDAFDMPVSGKTKLQLGTDGRVVGGEIALTLSAGKLRLPGLKDLPLSIDGGNLNLRYDNATRKLDIAPSRLTWGQSFATITGSVVPAERQNGRDVWKFDIKVVDGELRGNRSQPASLPIRAGSMTGWITPAIGRVQLEQFYLNADGAEVAAAADVVDMAGRPRARLEGRLGAMPISVFKVLWPSVLAPKLRAIFAEHLKEGQITGGVLKYSTNDGLATPEGNGAGATRNMSLTLRASDLGLSLARNMDLLRAKRALLRLEGNALELTIPKASIKPRAGQPVTLKAVRFTAVDIFAEQPLGELEFTTSGRARDALGLARMLKVPGAALHGTAAKQVSGKFKGKLKLRVPLDGSLALLDLRPEGRITLRNGSIRIPGSPVKISGVAMDVDVAPHALNVAGQMLVDGVAAKLNWQWIFGEPAERQPPLRLSATLDDADRTQLGMDFNHLVSGNIAVDVTVSAAAAGRPGREGMNVQVRADLTDAELQLRSIAWRKPAGRQAILEFTVHKGTLYPTELQNFKLVGDDIAIDGWVALDANQQAREFFFPEFSVNVITRLEVQGALSKSNVWTIKAKGSTFDGRDFFSAIYDIEGRSRRFRATRKNVPGIDLTARIDNVIGYGDVSLRNLQIKMKERNDLVQSIDAKGRLDSGAQLSVSLAAKPGRKRILFAETADAGKAFKLVGFYPNIRKGRATLKINLDGKGAAETTGQLEVRKFTILGDRVVAKVLQNVDPSRRASTKRRRRGKKYVREKFQFDKMSVPFSVGNGQFVVSNSNIKGPLIGASMRGKVDFKGKRIDLGGTYVPLNALNSAFCQIPVIGQILTGPRCEGIFGITFAIQGKLSDPKVLVNPLSMLTPGIFRMLMEMTSQNPRIADRAKGKKRGRKGKSSARSSSSSVRNSAAQGWPGDGAAEPEVLGGWSAETTKDGRVKRH